MINGLQILTHSPLYYVKTPGNVSAFCSYLIEIANFQFFDTDIINEELFYFPEVDPYGLNFQESGFETTLWIPGIGSLFYFFVAYIIASLCYIVFNIASKLCKRGKKIRKKMSKYFFWNGLIRLWMEAYFDLILYSIINEETLFWDRKLFYLTVSNILSLICLGLSSVLPLIFLLYHWRNFNRLKEEKFGKRYKAYLQGGNLKIDKES